MVLHHVDVDDPELLGEGRQGRRRPPEDEFIVMDVLIFCLVLHGWKSTSSSVMLLVMIAEMMAMFVILMMMTNELHLRNIQCLQSSRSQVGGSNPDSSVEEKFQMTLNPWTGRSQLPPKTFSLLPPAWRDTDFFSCDLSVQKLRVF